MNTELIIRFVDPNEFIITFQEQTSESILFQSPFNPNDFSDIAWYLETYAAGYITDVDIDRAQLIAKRLNELGEKLFDSVFSDTNARRLFNRFQDCDEKRLIIIKANHAVVLSLPWELLRQPKGTFLMNEKLSIRRRYAGASGGRKAFKVESKNHLRVLFVVSRPNNASFLNPRSDALAVLQALQEQQACVELEFLRPATLDKLVERLENEDLPAIDILHFDGHGALQSDSDGNNGYLLFENNDGNNDFVSAETLADALYRKKIALVVLSACQTAMVGGEDALTSVAARLTHAGLPSVLAMTYSVLVTTTEKLFAQFYAALLQGKHIGEALDTARRYLSRHPERGERQCGHQRVILALQDWFVPALYQASYDSALLTKSVTTSSPLEDWKSCANLPKLQEAGFFGRSRELWQIERAFVQGVRRITLTGFGGQGKTYLAIEAGIWLQQTGLFQRVCFVDYAASPVEGAVGVAVSTLSTVLDESLPDENAATQALQKTATLLILDNLEVLSATALQGLLTAAQAWSEAGKSRLLLTTRQNDLPHAAYPQAHSRLHRYLPVQGLAQEDALAYFQTLQKLPPEPKFSPPTREALLSLFASVNFHPLSIGLVAGELKFRRPAELGKRLEHYLAQNPQNPLMASLKLSLDRLPAEQRELIQRLGVFQGGALESMITDVTKINETEWAMLRAALEATGLIQVEQLAHLGVTEPYLKFHPTLAPVLWQELNDSQQTELMARYRHSYYQLSGFLYHEDDKNPLAARAIALRELPNLLHAVYAALQTQEAFAVDFADNVNRFLNNFGLQRDKAALIAASQQASGEVGSDSWYLAQSNQGEALYYAGQYAQAESIFQTLLKQLGQTPSYNLCITLNRLGRCFNEQGKTAEAIDCYQQALAVAQQLKSLTSVQQQIGSLYADLADACTDIGDYAQATAHYQQSLTIKKEIGDTRGEAVAQGQLGTLAMLQGNLQEAEQRYQTALKLFQALNEPKVEASAWHQLGVIYQRAEGWQAAEQAYREAARIRESQGDTLATAMTWNNLALVTQSQGKLDAAEMWYRKAIAVQRQGNPKNLADSLNNLADLLQNQASRLNEAQALAEETLAIRKTLDEASAEIWKTYNILAKIADKQQQSAAAKQYRHTSRDSYLRFKAMPYQMKQYAWLIGEVLNAIFQQAVDEELNTDLQNLQQQGWDNLVNAIQQILNGERNAAVLLEPLDYKEAAIIHLILKGIENPESLAILFNS